MGLKNTIEVFEHESLRIGSKGFEERHWQSLIKLNDLHEGKYFSVIHRGIKFTEYVGIIQVDDVSIEILPKVDKREETNWREVLIAMLKECKKLNPDSHGNAKVKRQNLSLLELYFDLFLDEVNKLMHQGLVKQYRLETSNVTALKGKLEFAGNIRQNLIHKERFYTTHQVYDRDHLLHQIIFLALKVVKTLSKGMFLHDKCLRALMAFPEVKEVKIAASLFDRKILNRKTEPYAKAIELARLILLNYSPDIKGGSEKMLALLFDMNTLWEEYVLRILKKASKNHPGMKVSGQASKRFWERRTVRPDIVIEFEGKTTIIDTKWKRISNNRASIEDLRQMYVYNKYWGSSKSLLLYPKGEAAQRNITGNYYTDVVNDYDSENSCEIGYLDVIKNGKLDNDWAVGFIKQFSFEDFSLSVAKK